MILVHVLGLEKVIQALDAVQTSKSAFAESPGLSLGEEPVVRVDPDRARPERLRQSLRLVNIPRPHARGKTVACRVRSLHCLGLGLPSFDYQNRPEQLILDHRMSKILNLDEARCNERPSLVRSIERVSVHQYSGTFAMLL